MREYEVREGDIAVDRYGKTVLVLWKGYNGQPLVTDCNTYRPEWTTYEGLEEITGHINLAETILPQTWVG